MENIEISFIFDPKKCQDNLYKDDYAYYDYDKKGIFIHTYNLDVQNNISEICTLLWHEYLHAIIWHCYVFLYCQE